MSLKLDNVIAELLGRKNKCEVMPSYSENNNKAIFLKELLVEEGWKVKVITFYDECQENIRNLVSLRKPVFSINDHSGDNSYNVNIIGDKECCTVAKAFYKAKTGIDWDD